MNRSVYKKIMHDDPFLREPCLYAQFARVSSREARAHLPVLIDQVADSSHPVIITKLEIGRAALVPARDLWMHEMTHLTGMAGRDYIDRPLLESMQELHRRLEARQQTAPQI